MKLTEEEKGFVLSSLETTLERCRKAQAIENAANPLCHSTSDFGVAKIASLIQRIEKEPGRLAYAPAVKRSSRRMGVVRR